MHTYSRTNILFFNTRRHDHSDLTFWSMKESSERTADSGTNAERTSGILRSLVDSTIRSTDIPESRHSLVSSAYPWPSPSSIYAHYRVPLYYIPSRPLKRKFLLTYNVFLLATFLHLIGTGCLAFSSLALWRFRFCISRRAIYIDGTVGGLV